MVDQSIREKIIKEAQEILKSMEHFSDWKDLGTEEEVQGYVKVENNIAYIKGSGIITYPIDHVADFIWDQENRRKYEVDFESVKVLQELDDNEKLIHYVMKCPWPVDNREALIIFKRKHQGESIQLIGRSIEYEYPVTQGCVRAHAHIYAFNLINIEDIATEVIYYAAGDPKGSIPDTLTNLLAGNQAFKIKELRRAINNS